MVAKGMEYKAIAERLVHLPPDGAEPRPEHAAQAPDAQPRRAHPVGHPARSRRRRRRGLRADPWTTTSRRTSAGSGTTPRRRPPSRPWSRVHRAHLDAVPYENLDIMLGRPTSVEPADVVARLAAGGRAGYCFHQNGALEALLLGLGFDVVRRHGHVYTTPEMRFDTLLNHLVLAGARPADRRRTPRAPGGPTSGWGRASATRRRWSPGGWPTLASTSRSPPSRIRRRRMGVVVPQRPARQLHRRRGARPAAGRGRLPPRALDRARLALHPDARRAASARRGRRHGARLRPHPAARRHRRDAPT